MPQPQSSVQDIVDQFAEFDACFDDDQFKKFHEFCLSYNVDASCIVHQWMAFSTTRGLAESWDAIELFNREWLPKKLNSTKKSARKTVSTPKSQPKRFMSEDEVKVLSAYNSSPVFKVPVSQTKRQITPDNSSQPHKHFIGDHGVIASSDSITPDMLSPGGAVRSGKYTSRTNAGSVMAKFGDTESISWIGNGCPCKVTVVSPALHQKKYMFQKQADKIQVLNDAILNMADHLQTTHKIEEFSNPAVTSQGSITAVGRICCDAVGRLNNKSVLLEGAQEHTHGRCIKADFSNVPQYSLFPGQVIAVDGVNNTGNVLSVQKVYDSVPLPSPDIEADRENARKLSILVATGPYALSDSLDYSPLSDLIKYMTKNKPDLCVLMGPFVDVRNSFINNGELEESFEDVFFRHMHHLGNSAKSLDCQMVIVPSLRDAQHCHSVYPQPPFSISSHNSNGSKRLQSELEFKNHLQFVSDPCMLEVNGLTIGVTSTDILMHMTKSETSLGSFSGLDRLGRLTQHLLHQHSFYPLYPPGDGVNLDLELWETNGKMTATPHILLVPSDLKAFIKDVDGCCCVNPGRLTIGQSGGTFGQIIVDTQKLKTTGSLSSSVSAQIVRV